MKKMRQGKGELSRRQMNVLELLQEGKKTVTQMTIITGYSDIRGYVRDLRAKGVQVQDEWVEGADTRFKCYWVGGAV